MSNSSTSSRHQPVLHLHCFNDTFLLKQGKNTLKLPCQTIRYGIERHSVENDTRSSFVSDDWQENVVWTVHEALTLCARGRATQVGLTEKSSSATLVKRLKKVGSYLQKDVSAIASTLCSAEGNPKVPGESTVSMVSNEFPHDVNSYLPEYRTDLLKPFPLTYLATLVHRGKQVQRIMEEAVGQEKFFDTADFVGSSTNVTRSSKAALIAGVPLTEAFNDTRARNPLTEAPTSFCNESPPFAWQIASTPVNDGAQEIQNTVGIIWASETPCDGVATGSDFIEENGEKLLDYVQNAMDDVHVIRAPENEGKWQPSSIEGKVSRTMEDLTKVLQRMSSSPSLLEADGGENDDNVLQGSTFLLPA